MDESPSGGFTNHYRVIEFDSDRNMHVYLPMVMEVSAVRIIWGNTPHFR